MSIFNFCRTFYLDASLVQGASTAGISSIDLYFMYRPNSGYNQSGINGPGISMYLTETIFGVPKISESTFTTVARAEWNAIKTSSDASVPTKFKFNAPVQLETNKTYAFLISYDGNEQFLPWFNRRGYPLTTGGLSPGSSSQISGEYFEFVNVGTLNQLEAATSAVDYQSWWNGFPAVDLKFNISVARYSTNSYPVFANSTISPTTTLGESALMVDWNNSLQKMMLLFPASRVECVSFDRSNSIKQAFVGAQRAFQNTVFHPGGSTSITVSTNKSNVITANSKYSNGSNFSWSNVFDDGQPDNYLVVSNGSDEYDVRKVSSIVSNTVLQVTESMTFTNAAANFMITGVATVDSFDLVGTNTSLMFMKSSAANSSVRFTSCSIDPSNVTFANTGSGYSNSDVLYVMGYERVAGKVLALPWDSVGNHPAVANVVTDNSGHITSLSFSNVGCGFVDSSNVKCSVFSSVPGNVLIANTSSGSGANIVFDVSSNIRTELTHNFFKNCSLVNFDVQYVNPRFDGTMPQEVDYDMYIKPMYATQSDSSVSSGSFTYVIPSDSLELIPVTIGGINRFNSATNPPAIVSRSNEFVTPFANGSLNTQVDRSKAYSNSYVVEVTMTSQSDYVSPHISSLPYVEFGKYVINNDYTGENTNSGNAYAKHLTTVVNFSSANNQVRLSEDLMIFTTAYRPVGTDLQCFARIKNSSDPEAIDDEDWTRMEMISGANLYSSGSDPNDYVDLTYGFQYAPNTDVKMTGLISTSNNSSTLTGIGTTFDTEFEVGDLIEVYDPLFEDQNFFVSKVMSVSNSSSMTIDQVVSSNTAVGIGGQAMAGTSGLNARRIRNFNNQAFKNVQNDSIVRYYNLEGQSFDGFDTLQLKIVMLSSSGKIPRIHQIRGPAVSA